MRLVGGHRTDGGGGGKEYIMSNFNFNKVILGGRLTAAPELKTTPSGVYVTQFTVAVTRKYGEEGKERQADFIRVIAWRQLAEFVCKYFGKGSSICVVGSIQTRTFTDKNNVKQYVTEVVADEINFVDSKGERDVEGAVPYRDTTQGGGANPPPPSYYTPEGGSVPQFETIPDDEQLPF